MRAIGTCHTTFSFFSKVIFCLILIQKFVFISNHGYMCLIACVSHFHPTVMYAYVRVSVIDLYLVFPLILPFRETLLLLLLISNFAATTIEAGRIHNSK